MGTSSAGWGLAVVVACVACVACAGTPSKPGGGSGSGANAIETWTPRLELDAHAPYVSVQFAGGACAGELAGTITIERPDGRIDEVPVAGPTMEQRCVGCDPYPGAPPDVCDNACRDEVRRPIASVRYEFDIDGIYRLTAPNARLSCATTAPDVAPVFVRATRDVWWQVSAEEASAVVAAATPDAAPAPAPAPDASPQVIADDPIADDGFRPPATGLHGVVAVNHDANQYTVVARHVVVIASASGEVDRVRTDARGRYAAALEPGRYKVRTKTPKGFGQITGTTQVDVEVIAGSAIEVDFRFSDGTRCLDGDTPIATPGGPVAIRTLAPGDAIWTCDAGGHVVPDRVVATQIADAPGRALRLALADGRTMIVAPGHPLATGVLPGELAVGDPLDGTTVAATDLVKYGDGRSYDLLAASGRPYLANGIPLASTLQPLAAPGPARCDHGTGSPIHARATIRSSYQVDAGAWTSPGSLSAMNGSSHSLP